MKNPNFFILGAPKCGITFLTAFPLACLELGGQALLITGEMGIKLLFTG